MAIVHDLLSHDFPAAFQLWLQAGWNDLFELDQGQFVRAWSNAFIRKCVYSDTTIVAIGRANSDGVLYAMIHDIVVDINHRKAGLGSLIVTAIVQDLKAYGIKSIQLMAAQNQIAFYERLGFTIRPIDRPGMQYNRI